jgi:IS1 family transposase
VQLDEKWAFVGKKQERCVKTETRQGDNWDHVAFDPEHKLVVSLVPGKRTKENIRNLIMDFKQRTGGRLMRLMASDEYKPYREVILRAYGDQKPRRRRFRRGRIPLPRWIPPEDLLYATVHKHRRKGRVVRISNHVIYGTVAKLKAALAGSSCSRRLNVAFVERYNATDRHHNSRKVRKSYRFSKDWEIHNATTWFTTACYNFCWPVRTLQSVGADGACQPMTPAMSAGLTDHLWTLVEWLQFPVLFHCVS